MQTIPVKTSIETEGISYEPQEEETFGSTTEKRTPMDKTLTALLLASGVVFKLFF